MVLTNRSLGHVVKTDKRTAPSERASELEAEVREEKCSLLTNPAQDHQLALSRGDPRSHLRYLSPNVTGKR